MHGVGPSTVLGGRYAVQRRLERLPSAERWTAHDTTLERDVVVVCFEESDPQAAATLDAARRAAGLDNHRLVRVLDVGRSDGIAFFVEESIHDAQNLTHLLEQGGLPAEEARRIAGEAATGLEAARARGLHHLQLTPTSVLRGSDGTIKVRGVATAAALAGSEDVDSTEASRTDAVGVVALAYAALTSRWPLPGHVPGLEAAPHVVGGVPAPSEIAAGVPGDLDALCRLTFNQDEGPLTPGDFATQIAPWSPTQVSGMGSSRSTDSGLDRTIALPVDSLRAGPVPSHPVSDATQLLTPVHPAAPAAPETGSETTSELPVPGASADHGTDTNAGTAGLASHGTEPFPPVRAHGIPPRSPEQTAKESLTVEGDGASEVPGRNSNAAAGAAAAAAVGTVIGSAGQAAGQAAGAAAHKVGSFAKAAADKAAERRALRQAAEAQAEQRRITLDQALIEGDELEPPLPMLPLETAAPLTRDQSKLVLAIIAGFLALVTIIGFWGASHIGSGSGLDLGGSAPRTTVTVTGPPTTVPPSGATTTGSATTEASEPFPILSATGFDPEGDNAERNGEAPRVFDDNPDTFWSSEGYASPDFGGLKKGVGVRLDLGQVRKVSTVTLDLPDVSDVTVEVGESRNRDNAVEIGTSSGKKGEVTLTRADGPAEGQYVFVWFTKVSQVSDGRFRATLAEVTVS